MKVIMEGKTSIEETKEENEETGGGKNKTKVNIRKRDERKLKE